ncbi:ribosome-associated ATPase/putative transporter RbbA [Neisseria leonii]
MKMKQIPAVALSAVSYRYGKTEALKSVSLSLPRGSTVGLIGPDGVGKSTLLSLIAGVRAVQDGRVEVLGGDMADKHVRRALSHRTAYMPQGLGKNLYPTLSVEENIAFHAGLFGLYGQTRKQRMARLLEATGLSPFAGRAAGKLSGGMKQKLSLCCALVHNPELLILDEPTTGVDPLSRRQFWALVDALRAEVPQMTVLVATAYIEEAEQFEYLLAMDEGRLLADAPTREVMARLGTDNLEAAYIRLLPEAKQAGAGEVAITPFVPLPDAPPAMEAEGLSKTFGDFTAVDRVGFTIAQGEIFGFLGANGCGKSTTMKMLTGLLPPTSGSARLLGKPADAGSLAVKKRVGYMSQSFSLYEELSVRQNLQLHADLYGLADGAEAVGRALADFDLTAAAEAKPAALPLGIRQRLQLAAACLHKPEVLILDEPTSGVDPAARDLFWRKLGELSRQERITIFVSTHFMNEALRCDRISLMDKGRVLAEGTPQQVIAASGQADLEAAFIHYLEQNAEPGPSENRTGNSAVAETAPSERKKHGVWRPFSDGLRGRLDAVYTFAVRESRELLRDKIRLFFAALGPAVLLASLGWAISFDVSGLTFAVSDRDRSDHSRAFVEPFAGSAYFAGRPPPESDGAGLRLLQRGQAALLIDIPPGFGRDVAAGRQAEIGFTVDGTAPFNAANIEAYTAAIVGGYNREILKTRGIDLPAAAELVPRFLYNQEFKSVNAMVPGVLMLVLTMIPAVMSALAVVRERESGTIQNLYASPASVPQYLLGKQLPYIAMGTLNFLLLSVMTVFWFGLPMSGSFAATLLGGVLLVCASTALGLLISSFVKSQTAAFFLSTIGTMTPAVNFSGLMYPVATLSGGAYAVGVGFPASWFGTVSRGGFTKGLGFADFLPQYAVLLLFAAVYFALACLFLKKQE